MSDSDKLLSLLAHTDLKQRAEIDRLRVALTSIVQWSEAYPLNIFQEPDLNEAHRLLMAGGITLDAVSASTARHVVKGVGEIARTALMEDKYD